MLVIIGEYYFVCLYTVEVPCITVYLDTERLNFGKNIVINAFHGIIQLCEPVVAVSKQVEKS